MNKRFDICESCEAFWPSVIKSGRFICLRDCNVKDKNDIESKILSKIKFVKASVPEHCVYKMEQLVMSQDEKNKSL